ncbi:MAG: mitochondrial fission ELM1 family protein [Campylobacterales bacterium]|nr:mitochondrial fission ELM1 family protein [Campylobacterales bacterium]
MFREEARKRLKILKITDGRAGHITVSDGVIEAIKKKYPVEIIEVDLKLRAKFLLSILKFILRYHLIENHFSFNDWFIKLFYKNYCKQNEKIDLIVSTGGDTLFANVWLSKILNTKNIFCGTLKGINPKYFSLIISTSEQNVTNSIKLDILPTQMNAKKTIESAERFCNEKKIKKDEKYFVLLIGGDGSGYFYGKDDYENLIHSFISVVRKYGAKALITTSRRTGSENEKLLIELFSKYDEEIAYSVFFNKNPEKVVAVYLELATAIFVTEESGSMISESLFFKKPVFTLSPEKVKEQKGYKLFLNNLIEKKRINRITIGSDLAEVDLNAHDFHYMEQLPIDYLAEKIKPYIEDKHQ